MHWEKLNSECVAVASWLLCSFQTRMNPGYTGNCINYLVFRYKIKVEGCTKLHSKAKRKQILYSRG